MEYSLENTNYKSNLLFGKPIQFEDIKIHPLKIWEIIDLGLSNYNAFVSLLSYTKNEIMEALNIVSEVDLYDFVMLTFISNNDNDFRDSILNILSAIIKEDVTFSDRGYFLIGNNKKLSKDNFKDFATIIKHQNLIPERQDKVTTKKERDYKDMLRKAREKHKEYIKATGNEETDLLDIISAISCKHPSLNLFNIKYLTMYQLIDQFKRLNMIDDYFLSIDSLLAGADKSKVDIVHWSKKFTD